MLKHSDSSALSWFFGEGEALLTCRSHMGAMIERLSLYATTEARAKVEDSAVDCWPDVLERLRSDRGITKADAIAQIRQQSGASRNTLLAAYQGTAIAIESAAKLTQWCTLHHPGHALGFVELVSAPTAPNAKAPEQRAGRARRALEAALRGKPAEYVAQCVAGLEAMLRGEWRA